MANNYVKLTGNLGNTPEVLQGAKSEFLVFSLYTNESYFDEEKDAYVKTETPTIHDVIVFANSKVFQMAKLLKSGNFITLEGKLNYQTSDVKRVGKDGQLIDSKAKEANVIAQNIEVIQS